VESVKRDIQEGAKLSSNPNVEKRSFQVRLRYEHLNPELFRCNSFES
jgi:hypothetical protein